MEGGLQENLEVVEGFRTNLEEAEEFQLTPGEGVELPSSEVVVGVLKPLKLKLQLEYLMLYSSLHLDG